MKVNTMKHSLVWLLFFLLISSAAFAEVPGEMTFSGVLTDENGQPLNETLSVTLNLYDAPTGGNTLWTETKSVAVTKGFLNVTVGDTNPIDANLIDGETALFLGVTIGDDEEMSPRQAITSVPYATRASTVENVTGDISPRSVSVGGQLIIDENGDWVGSPTGLQGPQGERGERGPQGYAGESVTMWSADAESCPTGGVGFRVGDGDDQFVCNGAQGERGLQGEQGIQGERGLQGEQGIQGERGLQGEQGIQGERGLQGEQGIQGERGLQGEPGIQGERGLQGEQGIQGERGLQGIQGEPGDSVVSWSADTADCPTGGIGFRVGSGADQFVCNGEQGIQGPRGLRGEQGLPGADGQSVTSQALFVGDSDCPWGGTAFVSESGRTVACNGAPSGEAGLYTSMYPVQISRNGIVVGVFTTFSGLSSLNEVVEHKVVGPDGIQVIQKIPGRLMFGELTLRRGLTANDDLIAWRQQVVDGQVDQARSVVTITVFDERNIPMASWTLTEAWPSALYFNNRDTGHSVESLTLVYEGQSCDTIEPGSTPWASIQRARLRDESNQLIGNFQQFSGLGTESEVVEHKIIGPGGVEIIRKVPSIVHISDELTFRREIPNGNAAWVWRALVESGNVAGARKNIVLTVFDASNTAVNSWTLGNAWPSSMAVEVGPDGKLYEVLGLTVESLTP